MRSLIVLQCLLVVGCASDPASEVNHVNGDASRQFKLLHVGQLPQDAKYRYLNVGAELTAKVLPAPVVVAPAPPVTVVENPTPSPDPVEWTIQFPLGKATLQGNEATLKAIVNALGEDDQAVAHVSGHTDALGKDRFNKRLAEQRARNVVRALVRMGIEPKRVLFDSLCCIDNPPVVNPQARKAVIVVLSVKGN